METNVLESISTLISGIGDNISSMRISDIEVNLDSIECAIWQTENDIREDDRTEASYSQSLQGLFEALKDIQIILRDRVNTLMPTGIGNMIEYVGVEACIGPGRPRYSVDLEVILFLRETGFSVTRIAAMLRISRTTLWRRLNDAGHSVRSSYSDLSDEQLEDVMSEIKQQHPHNGVAMITGHLRARGLVIQRRRIRECLRKIDPVNSALRWGMLARRRRYEVRAANALFHMDGHHSLIRWRFVVHGCIDGFSRLIIFLHCSDNNRSDTVLALFQEGVDQFGLPSRVRGDKGTENVKVIQFMIERRGPNRGSFIRGKSVHNSRVERLWRDVFYSVLQTYYSLFYYLEGLALLDVEDENDLMALHYTYLWRINASLEQFALAYNHHPLRSENNWSPVQIWSQSMIRQENEQLSEVHYFANGPVPEEENNYGVDPNGPFTYEDDNTNNVQVPELPNEHIANEFRDQLLQMSQSVALTDENYAIEIYERIRIAIREAAGV